jgi:aminopeptidase-like protein
LRTRDTAVDDRCCGADIYRLIERLYPICRSITGDGVRQTLDIVGEYIPLKTFEVPSGTSVFDWVVPKEWNIRDAYIKDARGNRVVDFRQSNLHVVSYSVPIRAKMSLAALKDHLFSLPEHPDWIPYRTSYYNESWGFCLSHRRLQDMTDSEYEVCIDSTLTEGHLTYGECYLKGESEEEILVYTHVCHPSLCNDNLSGIAVATYLARQMAGVARRHSFRFVFAPGTIGSITWISQNVEVLSRIKHGLIVALVGDSGPLTYKRSRRGDADIDRVAAYVLENSDESTETMEFSPYGYDERQFGSPGVDCPVGRLTRSPNGAYPEYNTSADNLQLLHPDRLEGSLTTCLRIVEMLERNRRYINTAPMCEPQLGKRGLYHKTGGARDIGGREYALLWVLNQSDGDHTLLDIAQRSGIPFGVIADAADDLHGAGLLR